MACINAYFRSVAEFGLQLRLCTPLSSVLATELAKLSKNMFKSPLNQKTFLLYQNPL